MKIEKSVRKALEEFIKGDSECAMLFTCISIDGTARKIYPKWGSNKRFTQFIRNNYDILSELLLPGLDFENIRWSVEVDNPKAPGGVDFADIIYGVHRCCHAHGECLQDGFELLPNYAQKNHKFTMEVKPGFVRFTDYIILALLAITVLEPVNKDLFNPLLNQYMLPIKNEKHVVNEWWGKREHIRSLLPKREKILFDFTDLRD